MTDERRRELLQAYREQEALSPARRDALWAQLETRVTRGDTPTVDVQASVPRMPGLTTRAWAWLPKPWLGAILAAPLAYVGFVAFAPQAPPAPAPFDSGVDPTSSAPLVPRVKDDPLAGVSVAPLPSPTPETPAKQAERPRRHSKKRGNRLEPRRAPDVDPAAASVPPEAVDEMATVDRELALLRRANVALKRGEPRAALGVLDTLDDEIPEGALLAPRTLTRVLALCSVGAHPDARARARAFLARHPGSPYAGRLQDACPEPDP